jgi:membrane protein YdbS with pleckstrin-like domain
MTETGQEGMTLRASVEDAEQAATEQASEAAAALEAAAGEEGQGGISLPAVPGRAVAGAGALAFGAAALLLAATVKASRRKPHLAPGESILLSTRPRKVLWRYAATFGLWEGVRRTTRFTLTNRRLIIQEGVLHRGSRSVPLGRIQDVQLATGPWQGAVEIAAAGGSKRARREEIGPLRSNRARAFADELSRAVAER